MADLSLRGLRNRIETEKKGYSLPLVNDSLSSLRTLINDMYSVRSGTTNVTCTTHSGTSYTGALSIGEMNTALDNLKACTCDSNQVMGVACNCNTRTACSCQSRTTSTGSCSCVSRTADGSCSGYTASSCTCVSRYGDVACQCNTRYAQYATCTCVSTMDGSCYQNTPAITDTVCGSRTSTSNCTGYTSASCSCNNRGDACSCVSRTTTSVSCTSDVGADCPSRTACSCNSVKTFE